MKVDFAGYCPTKVDFVGYHHLLLLYFVGCCPAQI